MYINNGFSFFNIKGTYKINSENIVPVYEYGLTPIYSQTQPPRESIAFKLANIGTDNEVIHFCNDYGLLWHERLLNNAKSNNYIFYNANCSDFAQVTPMDKTEMTIALKDFYSFARIVENTLNLKSAIDTDDISEQIYYCLFFLIYDCNYLLDSSIELGQIRLCFSSRNKIEINDRIQMFVTETVNGYYTNIECTDGFDSWEEKELITSKQFATSATWQSYIQLLEWLSKNITIDNITPQGRINFSDKINSSSFPQNFIHTINNLSFSILSDIFTYMLKDVTPLLQRYDGEIIGDWKITTLMEAIFFELFTTFSQGSKLKKCPCCGTYFEVSKTNHRKKYCSDTCNDRMAQRRRREKQKQTQ